MGGEYLLAPQLRNHHLQCLAGRSCEALHPAHLALHPHVGDLLQCQERLLALGAGRGPESHVSAGLFALATDTPQQVMGGEAHLMRGHVEILLSVDGVPDGLRADLKRRNWQSTIHALKSDERIRSCAGTTASDASILCISASVRLHQHVQRTGTGAVSCRCDWGQLAHQMNRQGQCPTTATLTATTATALL